MEVPVLEVPFLPDIGRGKEMAEKSHQEGHPTKAFGWAARDHSGVLSPFNFSRRATGEKDVAFKVLFCGVCHSDLHMIKNEWGISSYPVVPGHEIVGQVTEVGSKVEKFKVGDKVGVGYMIGSCHSCDSCHDDLENYCPEVILTSGGKYHDGTTTYGGFSDIMVADEHYAVRIPENLPLDSGAPLLCAGITVYSPLRFYGLDKPGMHVGVVGLGGLGHVAVKFAKAMGLKVTVISTSLKKKEEALEHLGAHSFLVSRDPDQMQAAAGTMDGIIDTVSAAHPLFPLLGLLKTQGKLVLVGAPVKPLELPVFPLIMDIMVADEHYAVRIPENLPLDSGAPLLCAGITVYSPLRFYGLDKPGMHVGVVGLGGLGHVAVKFAKAMGLKVTVISTSLKKKEEALEHLGAHSFLVSRDPDQMQAAAGTMDGIIDTVSAAHPLFPLLGLLKTQGKLVLVGAPVKPLELPVFPLIMGRKIVGGSSIGGMKETQEMIDFAAENNITADVEVIPMDYVNTAFERLAKADVRYRFVIDVGNTLKI
uniref:Enoyl reductase (ER) domain-containing protein n=1 Tax=Salix viminalis TaxID=40686 RepID=A0A6N2M641_SALVM